MVVAVEGTIGAGKSECIECLRRMTPLTVKPEPVWEWAPFLDAAYEGKGGHVALQARIMLDTCTREPREDVVERSPAWQTATFVPAMEAAGYVAPHEAVMLRELHAALCDWAPAHTVFLRCDKAETLRRIQQRNRGSENRLNLAYIGHLHDAYETALRVHFPDAFVVDTTLRRPEEVAAIVWAHLHGRGQAARPAPA